MALQSITATAGQATTVELQLAAAPVGLEAVAATINDDGETLSEMVEPYLLKIGFIQRTPTGRRATRDAYAHLGKQPPASAPGQVGLFE